MTVVVKIMFGFGSKQLLKLLPEILSRDIVLGKGE